MPPKHHIRCFVRVSTRHSRKMQEEILTRYGGVMYYADEDLGLSDAITSLHKGDALVVTTLSRLASRQAAIMEALDSIHKRGAVVIEATTGRRSDAKGPIAMQMMADAFAELRGDAKALPAKKAREYGKRSYRKKLAHRTSETEAKTVWQSLKFAHMTNTELLALPQMLGWTQESAYRRLGKRGLLAGRPRNKK